MDVAEIAGRMARGLQSRSFDGSLKFDCGADGVIVLADNAVSRDDRATDCTIRITQDNLAKLITGKLNPMTGVMTGKLKLSGDARVAMKLGDLLRA